MVLQRKSNCEVPHQAAILQVSVRQKMETILGSRMFLFVMGASGLQALHLYG